MNDALAHICGVVVLSSSGVALLTLVLLHLAPTGLSPIHNAVSQYGISKYRVGYRITTIGLGVAGVAAAIGIDVGVVGARTLEVALLGIFGACRLVISWYPMDEPGSEHTPTGHAHGVLAILTFSAVTLSAVQLASLLSDTDQWHAYVAAFQAVGWSLLVVLVAMLFMRGSSAAKHYFGAVERAFYLVTFAFLLTTGVALIAAVP